MESSCGAMSVVDGRRMWIKFHAKKAWRESACLVGNKPFCQDNKRVATSTKSCCLIVLFLDTFSDI
jgi:hypothetical protein